MRRLTIGITVAAATLAALVGAPAAGALGLSGLSAAPDDVAAGAHSDFNVHVGIQQAGDQLKDLTIHLPPGVVGDPTATPQCAPAALEADTCPAASQVGETSSNVLVLGLVPLSVPGSIYNLEPQPGEPARFGIVLRPPLSSLGALPKITMESAAKLRQSDFGLDTVLENIPNQSGGLSIDITALDVTLYGSAGSPPQPFMRNPTSCGTATTSFDATSYAHPDQTASGSASFTPTDCASLPFSPTLSATVGGPGQTDALTHPTLTTAIEQDEDEAGLRRAQVILPGASDVAADNDALSPQCTVPEFEAGTCAPETVLGTAEATSPLLTEPLQGQVFLLQHAGALQVGLDLTGQLAFKLRGDLGFTTEFRPTTTFEGLPDIPISRFALSIDGGDGGLLIASRDLCELPDPMLGSIFDAHSGAHAEGDVAATVEGCAERVAPRTLSLKYSSAEGVFKGLLGAPVAECRSRQAVTVWHRVAGADEKLGRDKTNATGKYSVPAAGDPGQYYAKVPAVPVAEATCLAARSPVVTLR